MIRQFIGVVVGNIGAVRRLAALGVAAGVLGACADEPQPVLLGAEECAHCRMVISDLDYAAQALNTRGKAFKFDAIECMAEWVLAADAANTSEIHSLWVADRAEPGGWVRVEDASFLHSAEVRSPMGLGLVAHSTAAEARAHQQQVGGELLAWADVLTLVEREGGSHHAHALLDAWDR